VQEGISERRIKRQAVLSCFRTWLIKPYNHGSPARSRWEKTETSRTKEKFCSPSSEVVTDLVDKPTAPLFAIRGCWLFGSTG
jgi:hypothetical protein